MVLETVEIID